MFGFACFFPLTGIVAVHYVIEDCVDFELYQKPKEVMKARVRDLYQFWCHSAIWKTCLFILMFSASPTSGDVIFYFMR